ncbi:hypothetical protein QZH41_016119 [Actinostola sp. cb2023]|nr:hypothetical protein QZH41_016119 [Actinostola sp. cb2023]
MNQQCRWITGPDFLLQPEDHWPPRMPTAESPLENDVEVKNDKWTGIVSESCTYFPERRVVAWMRRFADNCRSKPSLRVMTLLSASEVYQAEIIILRRSQEEAFPLEYQALKTNKPLPKRSRLHSLRPFIDENGLLRVGGRLRKAPVTEESRNPLILDQKHGATRLIVMYHHLSLYCASDKQVLNELRQKYWVLKGLATVRKISFTCPTCRRRRVQPIPPVMADLPKARLGYQLPPFANTGVDYFGPIIVSHGRKREKRYGSLFTCLTTRAVHIEISHSLDTDSYLMAMRRMMARRGRPSHIWSDNGTNFVGAEKELRDGLKRLDKERIYDQLSQDGIQWHFNPPSSPHFGGIWERLVQSAKRALRVVAGKQCVTDETLLTFMAEVESLLNGRPLTHVSSDYRDEEALTPNHFLIGRASPNLPPDVVIDRDLCSRKRWKHAQVMANHFWKRWLREYLPSLTERRKWTTEARNVAKGDLVLIVDENAARGRWPLGRVVSALCLEMMDESEPPKYAPVLEHTCLSCEDSLRSRNSHEGSTTSIKGNTGSATCKALQFDKERKQHMKEYADKKRGLTTIQEGDQVLLKLERDNKLTPAFDPDPYTVIERKGASVVLQREEGYTLMRNVSAVKKVYIQENLTESELDFDGLNQAADPEPVPAQVPVERPVRERHAPPYLRDFVP